jgi:quercetin dioxygenase-like cupin family protein
MKRLSLSARRSAVSLAGFVSQLWIALAIAARPTPSTSATQLFSQDLKDLPGKQVVMLTVESPPGASSAPHRHDAHVFVYLLEGTLVMQVDGKEPVTLKPGDVFYENPADIHRSSVNPSSTKPAKFLVFFVKDIGKPNSTPVPAGEHP